MSSALTYATLLLVDAQKDITSSNILAVTKAAGLDINKASAEVFAKYATPALIEGLIAKLTAVGGGAASSAPVAAAAAVVEEKKEEPEEEEEEMGFGGLF